MTHKKKPRMKMIILIIILSSLMVVSLLFHQKITFVEGLLKDATTLASKAAILPFTYINDDKNKDQSEEYLIQKNMNSSLEQEIQELKEALELNKTLTEYETVNATILSRNKSYWFNNITIDKGKSSGIEEGMAVITKNGLIGKISKVSNYSSEVKLLTSDDTYFKVSVTIKTGGVETYAILDGYDTSTGLIRASGIDKTAGIQEKNLVVTSGLGSMFPSGIYIGEVEKIEKDKYDLTKTVYIKTFQNFNDIHYVTVLKVKS